MNLPARKTSRFSISSFTLILALSIGATTFAQIPEAADDPFIWLEEVEGERSLAWVLEHDKATAERFMSDSVFERLQENALSLLTSKERIPRGKLRGGYFYNFWQDAEHVRGIIRRTSLQEFQKDEPEWETLLDIDALNEEENESWVYDEVIGLPPDYTTCMIALSRGGKDAAVFREYDYNKKAFVPDGFFLPEAKSGVSWYDSSTLVVRTDFGEGSLTTSGYPRIVKLWKRGTDLSEAQTIIEGEAEDVSSYGEIEHSPEGSIFIVGRHVTFWETRKWIVDDNFDKTELPLPISSEINGFLKGHVIVYLHSAWLGFAEGTLIAVHQDDLISDISSDDLKAKIEVLFSPDGRSAVEDVYVTKDYVIASVLRNVVGKILYFEPVTGENGAHEWPEGVIDLPEAGSVTIRSHSAFDNTLMIMFQNFITPRTLYLLTDPKATPQIVKSLPAMFDASGLQVTQGEATSKDGTVIPYFLVADENLNLDGENPTLLYGYGGFRIAESPFYWSSMGKLWLERGGVFALANIRGGGEFGPSWHKAALLENKQKSYDDFIAVSEDLIAEGITSPRRLGIMGGSNGGLLVGAVVTQRPELFQAVICQVPLLDMLRYTVLPPGASWMGEFGNPAIPEQRAYIEKYSPYQNVREGVTYPEVLFVTSTKDDRVHPGHARKMAARMEEVGAVVHFFEETEGGHNAAADQVQRAKRQALEFNYLFRMLSK